MPELGWATARPVHRAGSNRTPARNRLMLIGEPPRLRPLGQVEQAGAVLAAPDRLPTSLPSSAPPSSPRQRGAGAGVAARGKHGFAGPSSVTSPKGFPQESTLS